MMSQVILGAARKTVSGEMLRAVLGRRYLGLSLKEQIRRGRHDYGVGAPDEPTGEVLDMVAVVWTTACELNYATLPAPAISCSILYGGAITVTVTDPDTGILYLAGAVPPTFFGSLGAVRRQLWGWYREVSEAVIRAARTHENAAKAVVLDGIFQAELGVTAMNLARHMLGLEPHKPTAPRTPAERKRCLWLLERNEAWLTRLPEMARYGTPWADAACLIAFDYVRSHPNGDVHRDRDWLEGFLAKVDAVLANEGRAVA